MVVVSILVSELSSRMCGRIGMSFALQEMAFTASYRGSSVSCGVGAEQFPDGVDFIVGIDTTIHEQTADSFGDQIELLFFAVSLSRIQLLKRVVQAA